MSDFHDYYEGIGKVDAVKAPFSPSLLDSRAVEVAIQAYSQPPSIPGIQNALIAAFPEV